MMIAVENLFPFMSSVCMSPTIFFKSSNEKISFISTNYNHVAFIDKNITRSDKK